MYGKLTVVCGPMFAGKTTETLKRILWAKNGQQRQVRVFKLMFDDRYSTDEIVSHDGLKAPAESIVGIVPVNVTLNTLIVFDEIQFFTEDNFFGNVIEWIKDLLNHGAEVVVSGLDSDWQGSPFAITSLLMGMADEVIKIKSNCTICGQAATKTFKKDPHGDRVQLGSSDVYESRCNSHWNYG